MFNSGRRGKRSSDGYGIISQAEKFNQTEYPIPIVNSFTVTDISYNPTGALAANTAGGETIVINGSGFAPGATIQVGSNTISVVTYIDQGRLAFTAPAASAGSYTIYVSNSNGGTGILVPGLTYSSVPTFQTDAGSLGSYYETQQINQPIVAVGDEPLTYSLLSGSLPTGSTLSSSGVITGTAPVDGSSTTYTFTARAFDAQSQTVDRQFSLTINTDVVTWLTPSANYVISSYEYAPISNVTTSASSAAGYGVLISANTLPTGITLNANTGLISGTVDTVGNTYTRLTATANTTNRDATRDVIFNINQDVVTWSSPDDGTAYSLPQDTAISSVTLSATSAAGFGVQYSANALPTGITLSGSTISGTPTVTETVNTLLTATANTTGRSATRFISWSVSVAGDTYWKYNTLLLSADSTIQTKSFVADSSNNNMQLTVVGDTRATNFNPYQEGYYSNYFDGSGDYLTIADNTNLEIGDVDFTIESWFNISSLPASGNFADIVTKGAAGVYEPYYLFINSSGSLLYYSSSTGSSWNIASAVSFGTITPGIWYHVAISRQGTNTRLFLNGTLINTIANSNGALYNNNTAFAVGARSDGTETFTGYISNVRIVKGTAVYTSAFTPPSTPLTSVANTVLLTCQSNRFIDNSPSNAAITRNGDVKVNGANPFTTRYQVGTQYYSAYNTTGNAGLSTPISDLFAYGTGDLTIECWIYIPSNLTLDASAQYIFDNRDSGGLGPYLYVNATADGFSGTGIGSTPTISSLLDAWHHISYVRNSNVAYLYVDGTLVDSGALTTDLNVNTSLRIFALNSATAQRSFRGSISNFRVIKGQALYTGNFTVPTSKLTVNTVGTSGANVAASITGTVSLLTCQDESFVDNSPNNLTLTQTGTTLKCIPISPFGSIEYSNTQITSYGSAYFDGTDDILSASSVPLSLGTGDYTVQFWAYSNTGWSSNQTIFTLYVGTAYQIMMRYSSTTNQWQIYRASAAASALAFTDASDGAVNCWTHVALVRKDGFFNVYLNGRAAITPIANTTDFSGINAIDIGKYSTFDFKWNGYISDFNVVQGTALYTTSFVPPRVPVTAVAGTQLLTLQTNGGATNNGFVDQSSFNNIITRNGNPTQGTFSPYGDNWSNYFDGSGDYLTFPNSSTLAFGTGAFTIEFWINGPLNNDKHIFNGRAAIGTMHITTGGSASTAGSLRYVASSTITTGSVLITDNLWHHCAIVRDGSNNITLYVDGVSRGTGTDTTNYTTTTGTWYIASNDSSVGGAGSNTPTAYISNLRVIKGTALYTTTFTPSTSPLTSIANTSLLTCQSNRLIDNSPNNLTITKNGDVNIRSFSPFSTVTVPKYYSNYFDGSGDRLTIPGNAAFGLPGDFTIELWVYPTDFGAYFPYASQFFSLSTGVGSWFLASSSAGGHQFYYDGQLYTSFSGRTVSLNKWNHVALVRSGTTVTLYIDGQSAGTASISNSIGTSGSVLEIGGSAFNTSYGGTGYISNLRILKGTALYTTTFTPPTEPLTAIANTSILTCQDNTFKDNSNNAFTITGVGDSKPLPVSPFTPTASSVTSYSPAVFGGSMYFDGTDDYLNITSGPALGGDFTIELWYYPTSMSLYRSFVTTRSSIADETGGTAASAVFVGLNGTSLYYDSYNTQLTGSGTVRLNAWNHVACVRSGSTVTLYLNGISQGTTSDSTTKTVRPIFIGGLGSIYNVIGYISDLRMIPEKALYTSNFYPGSAPLTPTTTIGANTHNSLLLLSGTSGGAIDATRTVDIETGGDSKLVNFSPYNGSYYSNYLDGSGDYLTLASNAAFQFGTGDFTIECWVFLQNTAGTGIVENRSNGATPWLWYLTTTNLYPEFYVGTSHTSNISVTANQWSHIAVTRSSGTLRQFVNGQQAFSGTLTTDLTTSNPLYLYTSVDASRFLGYTSNMRIIKGQSLYTGAFTPSTSPLTTTTVGTSGANVASSITGTVSLLTSQSNKFVDNSTNNFTITKTGDIKIATQNPFQVNSGQSYYFDGTTDYLNILNNNVGNVAFGDYTAECWFYTTVANQIQTLIWLNGNTSAYSALRLGISSTSFNFYVADGGGSWGINSGNIGTFVVNQWNHVAVTRSGSDYKVFLNGNQVGTTYTAPATVYSTGSLSYIGALNNASGGTTIYRTFYGYITDVRVTRGYARYTSNNTTYLNSGAPYILK